jgi:membrane protease YdiL (CAAX protease family)
VTLTRIISGFFVLVLIAGVPVLAFVTSREAHLDSVPRKALYFSAALSQWLLALMGALVAALTIRRFSDLGFKGAGPRIVLLASLGLILACAALVSVLLLMEHVGWLPDESDLLYLLIPRSRSEKVWGVLVLAPTAALCEEFLYRGYLLHELTNWFHSAGWAVTVTSVAFGLAHTYQRSGGVFRAAILGALLSYPPVHLGTLYPSMAAHFVVDAVAFAWLGPLMLRSRAEKRQESELAGAS